MKKFLLLFFLAANYLQAANVTLTDNGNGTVTMANGLVLVTFDKGDGSVSGFYLSSLPTTNLMYPDHDYGLKLTHIGSGTNDYWTSVSDANGSTYSVVTNNGQIVDVMIRNPHASGDTKLFPNGIWDWAEHHVMRAGEAGFYTYHVWRHWPNQPPAYYQADSWQGSTSPIFSSAQNPDGSTYKAWSYSSSDVPICLSIGGSPPGSTSAGVPGEVVILPYTNYWTQPTGTNYEPGWPAYTQPCGLTSDLHPTWTKYDYSSYQGPTTSARNAWGISTEKVGLWTILGSAEFINGGPTKLKGAVSGGYMYNDDFEGHGLGSSPTPAVAAGQVFTKVIGPFFMYANTGTNHLQLWQDAQNLGAQMTSNWPYAWMNESEQDYPRHRGTVTGTIQAKTGESTANAVVILGNNASIDWPYQGDTNFLFWTTADSNGNFTLPKVRPDNYVLFAYVPEIWGQLQISNVVVAADETNNLGVINWNPPHLQQRLWRVGTPDHTSKEFRFGNLPKQFGLWWRYLNERGQSDLNFVVGQSVESNDWYYAQCIMAITPQSAPNLTDHTQTSGVEWGPKWNVIFNLTNLPTTNVLFTLALAGGRGTAFYTYINGVNATPAPYQTTGYYTQDGANIYRDVVAVGRYQYYQISFPKNLFVLGTNTLSLTIRQGGASPTWNIGDVTNGYPDLLQGGLIYDFLQMETGPQVVISSPPIAPTGLSATVVSGCEIDVSWTNNATNATSIEILRSTDNSHFMQVGAVANNVTNYADTGLPSGTTYYYRVIANNADGNSPNSNTAQASTQAAQPPAVPGNLTAVGTATNQINLTWADNSGNEDGFNIERSTNGGNYSTIAITAAGVTSYLDTNLLAGKTYFYRVQAFRSCWGNSAYTVPVSAATLVPPAPVTPVGLVAIPGNTKIALSWLPSSGANSYNLKRATTSGGPYGNIVGLSVTNYSDGGLGNGTIYYYVVSAVNAGGEGDDSAEVAATPGAFVTAYWTNRVTGAPQNWDVSGNWTNVASYPDGTSVVVNVTADISAAQTNNVNQNITLGWLNIGGTNGSSVYTLAPNGGSLNFSTGGTNNDSELIQLSTSAGDTISTPITISNNLAVVNKAITHPLTLSGTISGMNDVSYVGPGSFILATNNVYSGNTYINGCTVTLANFTANVSGFGSGPVTLDQATLSLNSNNNTPPTPFSNSFYWNLIVPSNSVSTLNGDGRCFIHGTLTGSGTLNISIPYVRMELDGDWSAFAGRLNASGSDFRFNNPSGLPNAALNLNGNTAYCLSGSMAVGELAGSASSYVNSTAWTVGARNTDATFAGIILGNSITKVGAGTWTLSGNNTYAGATIISGGTLQIGDGGTTGSLGTASVTDNASLVFNRYDDIAVGNVISGNGDVTQAGFGALVLSAADTYSGNTFVKSGTLALTNSGAIANSARVHLQNDSIFDVTGTTAHAMILGSGKMISGDGSVAGNFTLANGATLAPGDNDLGVLTFSQSLTLNSGSKTLLNISHDNQTNNAVIVNGTFARNGTLIVSNADDPLAGGDVFHLFSAGNFSGQFSSVTLPALLPGLYWDTSTFAVDGTIRVIIQAPPVISSVGFSGGKLVMSGTGGVTNASFYLLASSNLTDWTPILTNQFDEEGNFNLTNSIDSNAPRNFYQIQIP